MEGEKADGEGLDGWEEEEGGGGGGESLASEKTAVFVELDEDEDRHGVAVAAERMTRGVAGRATSEEEAAVEGNGWSSGRGGT